MSKKPVLVCLHGWGGSKESFTELRKALKGTNITILTPDLPGFGKEKEPKKAWKNNDYADWVENYIHKNTKGPIFLLGHSHGGRIAMKLAMRGDVKVSHLFLCASAGIRHTRHIRRIIGLTLAKSGNFALSLPGLSKLKPLSKTMMYKLIRVHDYEKASEVMRQTLINVTQEDFRDYLHKIRVPTDIFWGEEDHMTPYKDAITIHRGIRHSALHSFEGVRHNVHRVCAKDIAADIKSHL